MVHIIKLDALYPEMEEATIGRWLVNVGDMVKADQAIAELITDKVAYEYKTAEAGRILAVLPAERSVIPVGTTLAVIGASGEQMPDIAGLEAENRRLSSAREAALTAVMEATATQFTPRASAGRGVRATPAARRLARERGVDLSTLTGSGPDGMITVDDIPA